MAEEQQQDGQKTIVAFVVGLLIGGMLVWAFSGPSTEAPTNSDTDLTDSVMDDDSKDSVSKSDSATNTTELTVEVPVLKVGDGDIVVNNQPAGSAIVLNRAVYPVSEGWIGVREFNNEKLGFILGVVRFSESQGLVPEEIILQRPTMAGDDYAIVIFTEDGDFDFNLANDVQIDTVFDTFTAE